MPDQPSISLTQSIHNMCKQLEFKKRKHNFYKPLKDGVFATLGFGIAHFGITGNSYINVIVGIIYENAELLSYKLTGYNRMTVMQPQIGIQLGYLMPEKKIKEWVYIQGADNAAMFDNLLFNIQEYAIPYQIKYLDPDIFFNAINDIQCTAFYIRDRYLPILYYLRGDKQSGLKVIDEAIDRQLHPKQPEIPHIEGATVELYVGPSYGRVDPVYLTFVENYRNLPEPNQNNSLI